MSPTPRRAKICHLIHDDGAGGGPNTVINHLTFYADYFDIEVIHGGSGRIAAACRTLGLRAHWFPIHLFAMLPLMLFPVALKLRRMRPDLLILHGQWGAVFGAIAGKLGGVPRMLYIAQWPSFYTDWDPWRVVRNRIAESVPCRLVDAVVAVSEGNYYQFLLRRLVPEGRLYCISNSLDEERIPQLDAAERNRAALGWNDGRCHVVSVGRIADQKRIDWLLRSWKIVAAEEPAAAHLWIVGDGPDRRAMERLAVSLGVTGTCSFLGAQDGITYLSAADIVAMTTLYEGHANIPLEAMACGKPIVANSVDGVTDSFDDGDAGYLVLPGDIDAFAARIIELIRDPGLREKMGARGRDHVRQFAKPVVMTRYLSLIRSVIGELNPGSALPDTPPCPPE
jgi:glycosyltransferase involved in cell wall biosynthesis